MASYIIRRVIISVPVLFLVTVVIFVFVDLSPGSPIVAMLTGEEMLTVNSSSQQEFIAAQKERLGLNAPAPIRYLKWLSGVIRGKLGVSLIYSESVSKMISDRIGGTLLIMGIALLESSVLGMIVGIISAVWQYSLVDYLGTFFSFTGVSMPSFFIALLFIYMFSLKLGWFPVAGMYDPGQEPAPLTLLYHAFLPSLVLGWDSMANITRYTRSEVLETIRQDYVTTARAKGLAEGIVIGKHVLRNALLPVVTIIGLRIPWLIGGAVIVETVFAWPGLGRMSVNAVYNKDYPVIMSFNLLIAVGVLVTNLLTDISYGIIDPRVRYE